MLLIRPALYHQATTAGLLLQRLSLIQHLKKADEPCQRSCHSTSLSVKYNTIQQDTIRRCVFGAWTLFSFSIFFPNVLCICLSGTIQLRRLHFFFYFLRTVKPKVASTKCRVANHFQSTVTHKHGCGKKQNSSDTQQKMDFYH